MFAEFRDILSQWSSLDTWIVVTGVLASMACALPGCFLVLRRQSMMGDALSHTSLLGVVVAYLVAHAIHQAGWVDSVADAWIRNAMMFVGAMLIGVLAAVLTEGIHQLGRVEASAALGVVFTVLFAIGLLLVRLYADGIDLDPGCVLYGSVVRAYKIGGIPDAAVLNAIVLAINLLLVVLFYKELRICAFDPALATSLGIHARTIHYALMALTAGTVVAAFESVGVILVIAMLIAPAATAQLLTDRLWKMIVLALLIAAASAILGHVFAITLPPIIFSRLGYSGIHDASTAGMMAVMTGVFFAIAVVFAPRYGILNRILHQARLSMRIASEDLLGLLFRLEEQKFSGDTRFAPQLLNRSLGVGRFWTWISLRRLAWRGNIEPSASGFRLTDQGRNVAKGLVRSHRLWESYLQKHFALPEDHLHHSAMRVEHFIGEDERRALAQELDGISQDPHGQEIPTEPSSPATEPDDVESTNERNS